eukprot:GHVT01070650.1.p1 GENE.GHVT01070650.1~~GHVT01070650.1.p1  ORF type:complete len:337 (-),score=70.68 GHVT01070650.1:210-1220(-)
MYVLNECKFRLSVPLARVFNAQVARALQLLAEASAGDEVATSARAPLRGCVLLAPMLSLEASKRQCHYGLVKPLLVGISAILPTVCISSRSTSDRYPFLEEYLQRDSLTYKGGVRARTAREMFRVTDIPMVPQTAWPTTSPPSILLLHNLLDDLCGIGGSLEYFDEIRKLNFNDVNLIAINAKCFCDDEIADADNTHSTDGHKRETVHKTDGASASPAASGGAAAADCASSSLDGKAGRGCFFGAPDGSSACGAVDGGAEVTAGRGSARCRLLHATVEANLLRRLQPHASAALHGLDVWHSLFTEPGALPLMNAVVKWIRARTDSGGHGSSVLERD